MPIPTHAQSDFEFQQRARFLQAQDGNQIRAGAWLCSECTLPLWNIKTNHQECVNQWYEREEAGEA